MHMCTRWLMSKGTRALRTCCVVVCELQAQHALLQPLQERAELVEVHASARLLEQPVHHLTAAAAAAADTEGCAHVWGVADSDKNI
jgi:hypothetical protein